MSEYTGCFTNVKYPCGERKKHSAKKLSVEDNSLRLGSVGWLQCADSEPAEHILVILGETRTFVTIQEYKDGRKSKLIRGQKFSINPKKITSRQNRFQRRRSESGFFQLGAW